ncbi:MAG: TonB-dependent receptor [Bacteroidales bacterium]|nr:TonB-dependent receptor [Bacteroidales bacterium]
MFKSLFIKGFLSGLFFLSIFQSVFSQTDRESTFLTFDQLTDQLEQKYQVQFFYKSGWFDMRSFNSSILRLSFNQTLDRLKLETDYSIITFDSLLYIFVPLKPENEPSSGVKYSEVIIIGNPDDYGKYTKATLQGKILDGTNGNPLPGASIFIDKLKLGVTTDNKGNYHIQAPVGEYTIRLTFMGYDENTQKIKLVGNGTLDLKLYEKSIKLPEVIISAERPDLNVSGTQMSFTRLDSRTIKELPVSLGVTDIIKSIALLPGVQTIGEFGTGFNVRGGSADQNLILLEDVPLFNSSHLFGLTSVVNSEGISSATLMKAGISAKYGERVASVLDIRFGADDQNKRTFKGGIGLIDSRLYIETPINKKVSLLVSARSSYSNWLLHKIPDIDLMNSSAHFYDANAFLAYNINTLNKINLFAYLSNDKFGFTKNTSHKYSNLLASVKWKHTFNNTLYFNLIAGLSNYRYYVSESDTLKPWESFKINSSILYKNVKLDFSWFPAYNHAIDFGINGVLYNIKPGKLNPLGIESEIQSLTMALEKAGEYAFYITDNFKLFPELTIDFGLRYSLYTYLGPSTVYAFRADLPRSRQSIIDSTLYNNNKLVCAYSGLEPRLSLRFSISDNKSVKLSYNRIHQYINLVSNTAVMTPSDVWKLSSPNLKPLRCDHLAIGYFQNFKNNSIESSIELYYKSLKNTIDYKNGAKILLNPYLETDLLNVNGINFGVELYVRKNSGKLTGWASYTYSRSLQKTTGIYDAEKINNNQLFPSNFDRPNNLIINLNYHISRRWRFGGTFTYSTGRPVTLPEYKFDYQGFQVLYYSDRNKYRLPAYHRLDVSITYDKSLKIKKKWKSSWTFSVVNLYGRKNAYSVFYKKEEHMVSYEYRLYDTYMLYIIGRPFPTLTYNFYF